MINLNKKIKIFYQKLLKNKKKKKFETKSLLNLKHTDKTSIKKPLFLNEIPKNSKFINFDYLKKNNHTPTQHINFSKYENSVKKFSTTNNISPMYKNIPQLGLFKNSKNFENSQMSKKIYYPSKNGSKNRFNQKIDFNNKINLEKNNYYSVKNEADLTKKNFVNWSNHYEISKSYKK